PHLPAAPPAGRRPGVRRGPGRRASGCCAGARLSCNKRRRSSAAGAACAHLCAAPCLTAVPACVRNQPARRGGYRNCRADALPGKPATEAPMALRINDEAPNFTAETTQGKIDFQQWIGDGWAILFSHPKDFTPVCTTELGYMAGLNPEFEKRNCKIIGLSVDPVGDHSRWSKDIEETQGH